MFYGHARTPARQAKTLRETLEILQYPGLTIILEPPAHTASIPSGQDMQDVARYGSTIEYVSGGQVSQLEKLGIFLLNYVVAKVL